MNFDVYLWKKKLTNRTLLVLVLERCLGKYGGKTAVVAKF